MFALNNHNKQGIKDGAALPGLALAATMLGFAAIAREAGFSYPMTVAATGGVWGLPGQMAMVSLFAGGGSLLFIFLAVAMANMRMLLMVISASDMMDIKSFKMPVWKHLLYFHMMAVTGWFQVAHVAPRYDAREFLSYYKGFAITIFSLSLMGCTIGYFIGDVMPAKILRVMIYVTPLYLLLLGLSARQFGNRIAVFLGAVFAVIFTPFFGTMTLFVAGISGGLLAFVIVQIKARGDRS